MSYDNYEHNEKQGAWNIWRQKVLCDINELKGSLYTLQNRVKDLEVDIAVLNAKAAMYGGGVALVVSAIFGAIAKGYF